MARTIGAEVRITDSDLTSRKVLQHSRIALILPPSKEGWVSRKLVVDGPRALGPVHQFLYLESSAPFILETANINHEDPQTLVVTRTRINRLFCVFGSYVAASVLPDPDHLAGPGQMTAIFG